MNEVRPPITILGTGALAMRFGATLARAGHAVTLAGTWAEGLAAMGGRGIEVVEEHDGWRADVATVCRGLPANGAGEIVGDVARSPYLLILVKSHQTPRIAPLAARLVAPEGLIVTLQNGLGNAECLAAAAGPDRVAVGVTTLGAAVAGPGRVRFGGTGR